MGERVDYFVWSDNWYIEGNKAWLVDGEKNCLLCLNLDVDECEYKGEIPDKASSKFRLNPRCIKCNSDIFLMPDCGDSIWVYQLDNSQFHRIKIENPEGVQISITNFWQDNGKIIAVSIGLRQIIEINIKERKIENSYQICKSKNVKISRSVKVGGKIYCISAVSNQIYQFDLNAKKTEVYTIPNTEDGFRTICYDGENFWLSGWHKAVYVWNKEDDVTRVIDDFPPQFGIYNFAHYGDSLLDCKAVKYDTPVFIDSAAVGQYIWYIPFQTNKIIYVDGLHIYMKYGLKGAEFRIEKSFGKYRIIYFMIRNGDMESIGK